MTTQASALTDIKKILIDFTRDILLTFPEQKSTLHPNLKTLLDNTDVNDKALTDVYEHCKKIYPERFFDILYQNNDVFKPSIEFLPGMDFAILWADQGLSEKTRETIWKYLQLLLFSLVSTISDGKTFGDTAKLFEAIDENEFKTKLEDTIAQMQNIFADTAHNTDNGQGEGEDNGEGTEEGDAPKMPNINRNDLPNPKDIHDHVTGMMNGKLGKLAKEIAEETAAELNMDMENAGSMNDVFKTLFQNPTKLMSLVKSVGSKLDTKLKSGDMKESELLQEASDIMQKMKSMPGMGDLQSMLAKMGMGHMMPGGGGKVNMNATQANIDKNLKAAKNRERMLAKLEERKKQAAAAAATASANLKSVGTDATGRENLVFSKGETVERSEKSAAAGPGSAAGQAASQSTKNKKKKNKNKNTTAPATTAPATTE